MKTLGQIDYEAYFSGREDLCGPWSVQAAAAKAHNEAGANAVRDEVIRRIRENIAQECLGDFDLSVQRAFYGEVVPSLAERPELAAVNKLRSDIVAAMRKYESAPMLKDMADTIARGGLAF